MKRIFLLLMTASLFALNGICQSPKKEGLLQPNILWITCEDMGPHLGSYGDKQVQTPHLDRLASEGIRYTNVFTTAGVCAPSRSAIITGMYQQSIGTHNMRTFKMAASPKSFPTNIPGYSAVIPKQVKCFPELLRAAGYYCTNNSKQDYQFEAPVTVWDENSSKAHWRNRINKDRPFFSVINLMTTHESQVWQRAHEPLLVDPKEVLLPPFYPDLPEVRSDVARFLSNVMVMDSQVGEILKELQEDNLVENTIIFFFSDHGDGLPFQKREIYDRGTHVPMIIRFGKELSGLNPYRQSVLVDDQLIDFTDLAPTVLSLAGVSLPAYLQGQSFLDKTKKSPRKYVFAARDRMDSEYDRVRSMRDKQFLYIRNYMPEKPYYQNINFRLQQPIMTAILRAKKEGTLNEIQSKMFAETKPEEELYDCVADPFQLNNLSVNPVYKEKLREMRNSYNDWSKKTGDMGELQEADMIKSWWNGADTPPVTKPPVFRNKAAAMVASGTPGASIGYKFKKSDAWHVYTKPFSTSGNDSLYMIAHRIGYQPSSIVALKLP